MVTALRLGPRDQGTPLTLEAFLNASYQEGYQYELIEGKLDVSPQANLPENFVQGWLCFQLKLYARAHPGVINHVTQGARVFVPGREEVTAPEPDVAVYNNFPLDRPIAEIQWQDVSPILVAEVLSPERPDKDLVRNVALYFRVPSIREYWVFDTRQSPEQPTLRVHRRSGRKWRIQDLAGGSTYTSRLLPGFALLLETRRQP